MDAAIEVDRAARATPHAWMLHRFLVPASRLVELPAGFDPPLGVIVDVDELAAAVGAGRGRRGAARARAGDRGRRRTRSSWRSGRATTRQLDAVAERGAGAKVRCGGPTPDMFPSPRGARAPSSAAAATAGSPSRPRPGLHHPIRDGIVHGFLNLLGAAVLAHAEGAGPRDLVAVLLEEDAGAFAVTDEAFTVRGHAFGAEAVAAARERLFTGYGSCSFSEPVEDLRGSADPLMRRREFLARGRPDWRSGRRSGAGAAARARAPPSSYGPLGAADAAACGCRPASRSRLIARADQPCRHGLPVAHLPRRPGDVRGAPTAAGCSSRTRSRWPPAARGSSAIRFRANGEIATAYRILAGTNANCAGGGTPWGTLALVRGARRRPRLGVRPDAARARARSARRSGRFNHEAVAVDPRRPRSTSPRTARRRPLPLHAGDATRTSRLRPAGDRGRRRPAGLEPCPTRARSSARRASRLPARAAFNGGEGIWYDRRHGLLLDQGRQPRVGLRHGRRHARHDLRRRRGGRAR